MNKHVKDLLPSPFKLQGQQISYDGDDKAFCDLYNKEQMIAFGELIIGKCANLADKAENAETLIVPASAIIKEHFGIKD